MRSVFADYMLFVERHAFGVVEANPEGTTLSGVSEQTEKYLRNFPDNIPHVGDCLPFASEKKASLPLAITERLKKAKRRSQNA